MYSKDAISPIIGVALMAATVVIVAIGLFLFADNFTQSTLEDAPTEYLEDSFNTRVIKIVDNTLYLQTNKNNLNVSKVTLGDDICTGNSGLYTSKTLALDIFSCIDGSSKQRLLVEMNTSEIILLEVKVK